MNPRWVLVYQDKNGNVSMVQPCQGRYTYDTSEDAYAVLEAIMGDNSEERVREVFGDQAVGTFGVRSVECWPGHNDPVACVFGDYGGGRRMA